MTRAVQLVSSQRLLARTRTPGLTAIAAALAVARLLPNVLPLPDAFSAVLASLPSLFLSYDFRRGIALVHTGVLTEGGGAMVDANDSTRNNRGKTTLILTKYLFKLSRLPFSSFFFLFPTFSYFFFFTDSRMYTILYTFPNSFKLCTHTDAHGRTIACSH